MTAADNKFAHLTGAALTDIGCKRKNNEDSYGAFPEHGVWCVADGMGGGDDGEVASSAVVKSVDAYLSDLPTVCDGAYSGSQVANGVIAAVAEASGWIFRRTRKKKLKGCGSTFVGIVFDATNPGVAIALHVGDSRLYRLRGKELRQITKDHSVAEMMGAKDEREINPMFRGMILRAVGIESSVEVDQTPMSVNAGDVILVCSDGLTRMVPDRRIGEIIREGGDDVQATAGRLVAAANEAGGIDNITVALVRVGTLPPPMPTASSVRSDESSVSSSTVQTLEREYGVVRRGIPRRALVVAAAVCAVVAFGWAVSRSFTHGKPRSASAPTIEAMPTGTPAAVETNVIEREPEDSAPAVVGTDDGVETNASVGADSPKEVVVASNDVAVASNDVAVASNETSVADGDSNEDRERDAVEEELRAERERRKRADDAAAGRERERRQVAQELAQTYDRSFVEFARFVNVVFGKGASDQAQSLCRQLEARRGDADVSMYATDFVAEIADIAARLVVKCSRKSIRKDNAVSALATRCRTVAGKDPSLPETQRRCLELIEFVAEQRMQNNGRK